MAKKMKRQVTRTETAAPVENTASRYPVRSSSTSTSSSEFNPDYSYVISDLKRIGILAGSFITILVVLSFFLR
ncbi:MAG TPA: hypothetical protein VIO36_15905 [Anaerolineaceae bacterium]